jgi:hypothetical protein
MPGGHHPERIVTERQHRRRRFHGSEREADPLQVPDGRSVPLLLYAPCRTP